MAQPHSEAVRWGLANPSTSPDSHARASIIQVLDLVRGDPQVVEGLVGDEVDLVDHDPVPHPAGQTAHDRLAEAHEEADGLSAVPAGVGGGEVEGHLVVGQREDRFHAVGPDLVDEALVEGQALLVGLGLVAEREDAAPGDGEAEDLEAHLRE